MVNLNNNYKVSAFNISKKNKDKTLTILNTYTNLSVVVEESKINRINEILNLPNDFTEDIDFLILKNNGIIVDKSVNEYELIQYEYYKLAYQTSKFTLTIIPTRDCNFSCSYCYQKHEDFVMKEKTYDSIINLIENKAAKFNKMEINWFGGEPLLEIDSILKLMEKINKIVKKHRCALISKMTTNGYLLNYNTFEKLLKLGVLYYQITIDGTSQIHNIQRPHINGDSFEVVINNLREISKKSKSNIFKIALRTNLTNTSKDDIYTLLDCYAQMFSGDKRFGIDLNMADDWGGDSAKGVAFLRYDDFVIRQKSILDYMDKLGLSRQLNLTSLGDIICCAQRENNFIIDYDGSIHKCTIAMFFEEHREVSCIGYLKSTGELVIDTNKHIFWLFDTKEQSKCRKCSILPYCMGRPCVYAVKVKGLDQCSLNSRNNPIYKLLKDLKKFDTIK